MIKDSIGCLSVSQLTEEIRELLENGYPYLQVQGEVVDYKMAPSGHIYFTLADAQARIRAVIWKATRTRIPTLPRSGDGVIVTGRITVYAPRGEYQLVVEGVRPAGAGSEREKWLALHARLSAEGLFAPERKRPLPLLPRAIGVVTSPTGAAIHDIIRTLDRRFPGYHLILAPARVQGEEAPEEIARALFRLARDGRAEVILCGRGGGSADDLAAFNSERVIRAIAASPIPVISAVGHEIDVTLADLAADARASTPSAAAEMAMPEWNTLTARVQGGQQRLRTAMTTRLRTKQEQLKLTRSRLIHPRRRIEQTRQRCDELQIRLLMAMKGVVNRHRHATRHQTTRLTGWAEGHPLAVRTARLDRLHNRLLHQINRQIQYHRETVRLLQARLTAISPLEVLTRGYALVQDEQGTLVRDARRYPPGTRLRIRLAQGELTVQVTTHAEHS
ncbi:MAG: exodeoxyribonuclease VII large subunit [Magnetococcales bacterium]|nr:exodeoxyribonuclease VII large subunit [Magnetococcales bacterium]NGZ06716.1 exodeoxyribonuclease VII large subunit [Magnetococcales bacterium]